MTDRVRYGISTLMHTPLDEGRLQLTYKLNSSIMRLNKLLNNLLAKQWS